MTKIVLIGQAPSRFGDPRQPLCMSIAKKLSMLIGMSYLEYFDTFDRMNVLDHWPGANEKGDKFPMREARVKAQEIVQSLVERKVIFVGRATALAFGFRTQFFEWVEFAGFTAAAIPHPSGVNYWWNEKHNVELASKFLRDALGRTA
jgi:hypothetical protein